MWSSERGDVGVVSPFRETEVLPYQIPRYDDSDCEDSCDPSASLDRRPFRPLDSNTHRSPECSCPRPTVGYRNSLMPHAAW
jgi:hypothetical protein